MPEADRDPVLLADEVVQEQPVMEPQVRRREKSLLEHLRGLEGLKLSDNREQLGPPLDFRSPN